MDNSYHIPVLLNESLEGLNIRPDGVYVDVTFGGGGHSRAILNKLGPNGKLYAFDQDEDVRVNLPVDDRVIFLPHNFRHLSRMLRLHEVTAVDGILADLGVSSHQFDESTRGFSTRFDGALDMRMDQRQELTAAKVIETYSESDLHRIFGFYGEVTNAKTLARTIVQIRHTVSLSTISNLKHAVAPVVKGNPHKYFAQVFQALRIEVNEELEVLKELLKQMAGLLKPGGRVAVITFHSLEDRLVKHFFRKGNFDPEVENENPFGNSSVNPPLQPVNKKPITPSELEIKTNPRSRSAKLRIAEKQVEGI